MSNWEEMAKVVASKLVKNGQTRILQRIYDGITSNWVLDIADDKGSIDHLLIHLVWRKFPRNRHLTEDRSTVQTQTEGSSASLGLDESSDLTGLQPKKSISEFTQTTEDMRPGPRHISRNYAASNSDCLSTADLGELFEANESSSNPDADRTSDCSSSTDLASDSSVTSTNLTQDPDIPFIKPARRRSGKPLNSEKKVQTKLSNRFDGLEEVNSSENSHAYAGLSDRESTSGARGNQSRRHPNSDNNSKMSGISKTKTLSTKSRVIPITSEIPTTSITSITDTKTLSESLHWPFDSSLGTSLRSKGTVRCFYPSESSHGFINMDGRSDEDIFFHVNTEYYTPKEGDEVSFYYDECGEEAIDVKLELRRTDSGTYRYFSCS